METKQAFEQVLEEMERAMSRMASMHESPWDFGTGVPLYRTEIHTVQAIGEHPGINVTELAQLMGVTKGAVSQTVGKLADKGLVSKTHAEDNAKEILLQLTERGSTGFSNHQKLHMAMLDIVRDFYGDLLEEKLQAFASVMRDLNKILTMYEEKIEQA
jgi:DNA-binding MarR family transcriptional regulator